ncbi:MAG: tRNA 2-thiocytidine biosynthesis TtcA family protein [Desulfovibrionaceae bacterium]|nr:tRNA 2-thiocytidine biosynthesis protein TtcA [Desulfovibrionaceae bacterium]MDD4951087.1 tRNA 2-thiocytidine biosynthesis TtcA family protein [Desulfovibrionaceae bacterium]
MAGWGKLTFAQKKCVSTVGLAMHRTQMVRPGSRVGVAVSGGVDSFALLQILILRQAIVPFDLELMVLHVNPGFDRLSHLALAEFAARNGLAAHLEVTDFGPRAHSKENLKRSPCFLCSRLRRKRLFDLCRRYRLSHLAFGHTADDLLDTFFMNLMQNGRVEGLSISEPFFNGRLQVVRPALLLEKGLLRTAARQWGLPIQENPCPSNGRTKRDQIHSWLARTWSGDKRIRNNLLNGLVRWQLDAALRNGIYPGPVKGRAHSDT